MTMHRRCPSALLLLLIATTATTTLTNAALFSDGDCEASLSSPIVFSVENLECNYTNVLAAFDNDVYQDTMVFPKKCIDEGKSVDEVFHAMLGAASVTDATIKLQEICFSATVPKQRSYNQVAKKYGNFEEIFFSGGTDWNEIRQSKYPKESADDNTEKFDLQVMVRNVNDYFTGPGTRHQLDLPLYTSQFQSGCPNTNAAVCCWVQDHRRGGGGNCDRPYDTKCVDSDPADNTDLCYVPDFDGKGTFLFPRGDGNDNRLLNQGEGRIHCHGLAWGNDNMEVSRRYRGNVLMQVSMQDHLRNRGYVKNVPGAPMCGCTDQMPAVSRADCTEILVTESYTLRVDSKKQWSATLDKAKVTKYRACEGLDLRGRRRTNDLGAYFNRLHREGKVSSKQYASFTEGIVGDDPHGMCDIATAKYMAKNGLKEGYNHDEADWIKLAGTEELEQAPIGQKAFNYLLSTLANPNFIVRRVCTSCVPDYTNIYYKRLTPVTSDLMKFFIDRQSSSTADNKCGVDFELYSTYEDAVAGTNKWECAQYNYGRYFPGEIGPNGKVTQTTLKRQYRRFARWDRFEYRKNVAFYLNAPTTAMPIVPSENVGIVSRPGITTLAAGNYYMNGAGNGMSRKEDDFHFMHQTASGDFDLTVQILEFQSVRSYSRTGIMIRDSMYSRAMHASVILLGNNHVYFSKRATLGGDTRDYRLSNSEVDEKPVWLKLVKRGNMFMGYKKQSEADGWIAVQHPQFIDLDDSSLEVGFVVANHDGDSFKRVEAKFTNFKVEPFTAPTLPTSPGSPRVVLVGTDVGSVGLPGSSERTGYEWKLSSASSYIHGRPDSFHFYNQQHANNDFTLEVRVKDFIDNNNGDARAGLMIRDSTDPRALYASAMYTERTKKVLQYSRETYNANPRKVQLDWPVSPPEVWLKLVKRGDEFTAYYSTVRSDYIKIATHTVVLTGTLEIGLVYSSYDRSAISSALFDYFSITEDGGDSGASRYLRGT